MKEKLEWSYPSLYIFLLRHIESKNKFQEPHVTPLGIILLSIKLVNILTFTSVDLWNLHQSESTLICKLVIYVSDVYILINFLGLEQPWAPVPIMDSIYCTLQLDICRYINRKRNLGRNHGDRSWEWGATGGRPEAMGGAATVWKRGWRFDPSWGQPPYGRPGTSGKVARTGAGSFLGTASIW